MTSTTHRKVFSLAAACTLFAQAPGCARCDDCDSNNLRQQLGDKAAGLASMIAGGINVPPGVAIVTSVCRQFHDNNQTLPTGLFDEVLRGLSGVEQSLGRRFGDDFTPLLLAVRASPGVSMPGMTDSILNVGLTDYTAEVLARQLGERPAIDSYRRFIEMYGTVVLGISKEHFDRLLTDAINQAGVASHVGLSVPQLRELVEIYKTFVWDQSGNPFPQNPHEQLKRAIESVFKSFNSERAVVYRELNGLSDAVGLGVIIQAMVFGNLNDQSGTGQCFTRDPRSGEAGQLVGEYLLNSQGKDVPDSVIKPKLLFRLQGEMPHAYEQLGVVAEKLEGLYGDMQEIHFTIENGELFVLRSRSGWRTAEAAVHIAVDLALAGAISRETAVRRIEPAQWNQLLRPVFNGENLAAAKMMGRHVATGIAAAPGCAVGKIVFDPAEAAQRSTAGEKIILVGAETCPADIAGIAPVEGIVTARGGMTCFGAGVARGQGKPCIAGCDSVVVDRHNQLVTVGRHSFFKDDVISIDGSNGEIYAGTLNATKVKQSTHLDTLLEWAKQFGIVTVSELSENAV
jgi:pyruvate,orthophosphate dikinase